MTAETLSAWVREEIALRLEAGAAVSAVQRELVDSVPGLAEDEQAALWLFAWAYPANGRARVLRP